MTITKPFILAIVLFLIVGAIWFLETSKSARPKSSQSAEIKPNVASETDINGVAQSQASVELENKEQNIAPAAKNQSASTQSKLLPAAKPKINRNTIIQSKSKKYSLAKEIVSPAGFINTQPIKIQNLIGKKVILIDFWTYSCINCQRTLPYLNTWFEKYKSQGLVIVGVHTPEFEFEEKYSNVLKAVQKFGIKYPVILDNDYGTWGAYGNRYWPRKYLIDIDGFIVYDHIGEGAYAKTEKLIQVALTERAEALNLGPMVKLEMAQPQIPIQVRPSQVKSPEVYFGARRNEYFGNGQMGVTGVQSLTQPENILLNQLYLVGDWNIQDEFVQNQNAGAKIIFRYSAQAVYFVASSPAPVKIKVLRDGQPVGAAAGEDVFKTTLRSGSRLSASTAVIQEDRLYKLIEDSKSAGEHTLEIIIESGGLKAFTFTFG